MYYVQAKLESERIMSVVAKNKSESENQKKKKMQWVYRPVCDVLVHCLVGRSQHVTLCYLLNGTSILMYVLYL